MWSVALGRSEVWIPSASGETRVFDQLGFGRKASTLNPITLNPLFNIREHGVGVWHVRSIEEQRGRLPNPMFQGDWDKTDGGRKGREREEKKKARQEEDEKNDRREGEHAACVGM